MRVHRRLQLRWVPVRDWIWITGIDGAEHLISEPAVALGRLVGAGRYVAACARLMTAAAMVTPPDRRCVRCAGFPAC